MASSSSGLFHSFVAVFFILLSWFVSMTWAQIRTQPPVDCNDTGVQAAAAVAFAWSPPMPIDIGSSSSGGGMMRHKKIDGKKEGKKKEKKRNYATRKAVIGWEGFNFTVPPIQTDESTYTIYAAFQKSLFDVVQYKLSGVIYLNGTCVIAYSQVIVSHVKGSHVYNVVDPGTLLSCEEAEIYVGSCNAD